VNSILSRFDPLVRGGQRFPWASWLMRLPPAANVLMVLLLANVVAILTWKLIPLPEMPPAPLSMPQAAISVPQRNVNYDQISNWHLFGEVRLDAAAMGDAQTPDVVPDTTLQLTLRGVIASKDLRIAFAIIGDPSGTEETYRVGDQVPGGAQIKEIHADKVILWRNNRHETLRLPEDALPTSDMGQVSRVGSFGTPMNAGGAMTVSPQAAAVLKDYRQKLASDPQALANVVRAEPYHQGGKLTGYRIFPGTDRTLLNRVGLQPGDVITSVNGIEFDSPSKGLEIMKAVTEGGGGQVSVNVLRNGATQTYMVPLN